MAQSLQPIPITISGHTPWIDVRAYGAVGDGSHDDTTAIQAAIDACPDNGCTIYFGAGGTYLISAGLTITDSLHLKQGIRLLGECGGPSASSTQTCSHLVSSTTGIVMLTVGDGTHTLRGLTIQDLGFQDISAGINAVTGAIRLWEVEDFNLTNLHCTNILGNSTLNGYCFLFDGGSSFTQFGVVINPVVDTVRFPIQTASKASEVNVYGGNLACSSASTAIAMDMGKNNPGSSTGGEWGVFGTHILNCATGISMYNNANMNYYGIMEQTGVFAGTGTGIVIDGNTAGRPEKSIIAGSINNFDTGVLLDGNAANNRILANISSTTNPIVIGGSAISSTLPSTLILTTSNYAGGGTAIGTQIPTDVTMPAEAKPAQPATGSRRLYADSGASNDLSVEHSDGTAVDLEAASRLLSYQEPASNIQGNGSDQTVYTFSVPPIPDGKGIRARVYWQCTVGCSTGSKIFKWQFGSTTTAYAGYTTAFVAAAYTEVRIFNRFGSHTVNNMYGDAITVGTAIQSSGTVSSPNQDTSGTLSLKFLFNAPSTETITPKGFIVEAIQ